MPELSGVGETMAHHAKGQQVPAVQQTHPAPWAPPPGYGQPPPGYAQPPPGYHQVPTGYYPPPAGYVHAPARPRGNLRVFWIIWCSFWALFWLLAGFATLGIGFVGVPFSLLAILIPVGTGRQQYVRPPDCFRCGYPADRHVQGWCPGPPIGPGR